MLMLDVRNAITNILDRYTLADVVEITLRKLRKNRMPLLFSLDSLEQLPEKAVRRVKRSNGQAPVDKVAIR
jgi:hypothetical protein